MSVSVAWRCCLYHIIMPRSSSKWWLNTMPQDSLLQLVTQHSLDQIQLLSSLLISSHSGNSLVVCALLCCWVYFNEHNYTHKWRNFFSQTWCIKITHTDLTCSSVSVGVDFKGKGFNICPWHWKRSSEQRRKWKTKISGPPQGCLKTAWLIAAVETMWTILLRTSRCSQRVRMPTLWWMFVTAATRPPTPPTGQNCFQAKLIFLNAWCDSDVHYLNKRIHVTKKVRRWIWTAGGCENA